MRKILLLGFLLVSSIISSAQNFIGGNFGIVRDFTTHETNFTIAPELGYNFSDNWGVGLSLNYVYKNYDSSISNAFSFNPDARFTFARVADDKLRFFLDSGFSMGFSYSTNSTTALIYNLGFKPGISYAFNEHWNILCHLGFIGYEGTNSQAEEIGYHRKLGLDFSSMNLNFGLFYNF